MDFGKGESYRFAAKLRLLGEGAGFFLFLMLFGIVGLLLLDVYPSQGLLLLWAIPIVTAVIVLGGVLFTRKLQYDQPSLAWYIALVTALFLTGVGWAAFLVQALEVAEPTRQSAALVLLAAELMMGALLFAVDAVAVGAYLLGVALASAVYLLTGGQSLSPALLWLLAGSFVTLPLLSIWGYRYQRLLVRSLAELDGLRPQCAEAVQQGVQLKQRLETQEKNQQEVKQELYLAKDAAESASVAKTEFLATMSHEIRTPLNGIVPILEILRETILDEEQLEFVSTALNSSHHLLNLINDILDYSKIEAGKLELESIELDVPELIESVIALLTKAAERRGTRLVSKIAHNAPRQVRGDPFRLRQILTNLVGNAIKFTEHGTVSVEVNRHASSAKEVVMLFAVRDTGVGMSEAAVGRLFQMFSQADATTTRKHGGSGLGLVICKRLVEMMGGRIGVKSDKGKGSVFWFVVPMRKTRHEVPLARTTLAGGRVLLAGFDQQERQRIVGYLDRWEMLNEQALTSLDTLNKLKASAGLGASWGYDVLLLDAQAMGSEISGLIYGIGKIFELSSLVIIAVDAFPSQVSVLKDQGIAEVIPRPLQEHELRTRLHRLLDVQTSRKPDREKPAARYAVMPDAAFSWEDAHRDQELKRTPPPKKEAAKAETLVGRVLVVEDNPVNLSVMRKLLQRLGLQGDEAGDGVQAVEAVARAEYDLVLMDVQMPNMDGLEATRWIRRRESEEALPHIAIVAMTANAMAGDRENCLDAGMDDYMSKPIKPADLKSMLIQWLPEQPAQPAAGTGSGGEAEVGHRSGAAKPSLAEAAPRPQAPPAKSRPQPQSPPAQAAPSAPASAAESGAGAGQLSAPLQESLDSEVLHELFEIMEEDALALLQQYLDNAGDLLKEIHRALVDGNAGALVLPAHSLKSSSANVGAMQVSGLAKRLEFMGREENMGGASACWKEMQTAYSQAAKSLKEVIERRGA